MANKQCDLLHQEGTFTRRTISPSPPFHCPTPTPPPFWPVEQPGRVCVWISRGCSLSEDGGMLAQCQGLSKEVTELSQEEKKLDELIQSCTLDLKLLTEDSENQRLAYVTYQDIRKISGLKDQTVNSCESPSRNMT